MMRYRIALFISLLLIAGCASNLRIMHTNDSHAAFEPTYTGLGGYKALEYHLNEARKEAKHSLYLDAGDMQIGSIFSSLEFGGLKGGAILEVFHRLGLDAATLGNHEFDLSYSHAESLVRQSKFPILSANLLKQDGSSFGHAPYKVIKKGRTKIGIIGLTIDSLPLRVKPENVAPLSILPYKEALDKVLDEVKAQSDIVVLLTHNGWEADSLLATRLDDRVDLIVGGHSHLAFSKAKEVNGIYIVSSGSHLQYLGIVDLKLKRRKIARFSNRLQPLNQPPEDYKGTLDEFLEETIGRLNKELGRKIAILPFDFEVDKYRITEGSLWVAKALLAEYPTADIAMINNGGLRKHLPKGELSLRQMYEYIPFGNTIVLFSCYGKDLIEAHRLNRSLAKDRPHDLMSTSLDSWLKQDKLYLNGKEIEPDRIYRIVSHDYILSQWDKYIGAQPFDIDDTGALFLDAIVKQMEEQFN